MELSYKFKMESTNKNLISFGKLEDNFFFPNNYCESLNHLINSYIVVNNRVSLSRFYEIIKTLFIRMKCGHSRDLQANERIKIKRKMSDILTDLIKAKIGVNLKIITYEEMKKLKSKPNIEEIFELIN